MGQHKQKQDISKWQQRKKDIDEAIAKRILHRVHVDPSGMFAAVAASFSSNCPTSDDETASMPSLVDKSDDDIT